MWKNLGPKAKADQEVPGKKEGEKLEELLKRQK